MSRREASETVKTSDAALDGVPHHAVRVGEGHPVGQVLGEEQVDAVVDGDHRPPPAEQGQDVVRRMQEVDAQPPELGRDGDVLAQAVAPRVVHHGHEVLGEVAQRGFVAAIAEEEVGRVPIELGEMAHEIPDIGPDPVVAPLARVDGDFGMLVLAGAFLLLLVKSGGALATTAVAAARPP